MNENSYQFIDIKSANYHIEIDQKYKKASVKSIIKFETQQTGRPIFTLNTSIDKVFINEFQIAPLNLKLPQSNDDVKSISMILDKGEHTLEIYHNLSDQITFNENSFEFRTAMRDLKNIFSSRNTFQVI